MEHQQDVKKELLQLGSKAVIIGILVGFCGLFLLGIGNSSTGGDTSLVWIMFFGMVALIGLSVILLLFGALMWLAGLEYVDGSKRKN